MEHELVHVNLSYMANCVTIGDKSCMIGASSVVNVPLLIHSFSHMDLRMKNMLNLPRFSHAFHCNYTLTDCKHDLGAKSRECKTQSSDHAFMRIVFDPGGNQELNSRTNFLEEGGNDENHMRAAKV